MGLLPTLKGSKLAKDILPSLPTLKRRAVWLEPEFQYDGRDPPKAWLARLRQLKQIHGYSERETLKIAEKCLKGDAELWFRIQQPHSFNSLRTGLHTRFASRPVTSVFKRKAPVHDRLDAFLSDVHVPLAPKSIASCLLPNQGRASSKALSRSALTGSRSNSSSWKSTSRCLTPTRRFKEEKLIGPLSITATKKVGEEKLIPTRLEHQMKFEDFSCRSTGQQVVSSPSVPSYRNVKYSKNVSYKPKKAKQAVDMSSTGNCTALDATKNEKQSLAVSGWKTGQRNCTRREEKDIDEFSESSEEDIGFSIVPDELLNRTNKYMGNMQKNKDVLRLSRTNNSIFAKKTSLPHDGRSFPTNEQQIYLQFKRAIHCAMRGDWRHMSVEFCNFYLHCYGMRTSGSRSEKINRIREHMELTDGSGAQKYPHNTFTRECAGIVCVGDVIFFEQRLRQGYDVLSGNPFDNSKRVTVGRVVKDSKTPTGDRIFIIEVYWSKGPHAFPPMRPVSIKGVDLYRMKPSRQVWIKEEARKQMLEYRN